MKSRLLLLVTILISVIATPTIAFVGVAHGTGRSRTVQQQNIQGSPSTRLNLVAETSALSVVAGSLAGSIGIGVAFPLDTLKTKAQLYGQERREQQQCDGDSASSGKNAALGMFQTASLVLQREGIKGFYSGVRGVMAGEAVIKAVAFTANAVILAFIQEHHLLGGATNDSALALLAAACLSGVATSFFTAPVERVKVLMQANPDAYANEFECIQAVLENEGFSGLFQRGLGTTLLRDVPGYGIYFGVYGLLTESFDIGPLSSLLFGATAGSASWIPIYPIDTLKTLIQATPGGIETAEASEKTQALTEMIKTIYKQGGLGAFFEGMTPKVLRAAVNHAATFSIYDAVMEGIRQHSS